jgi:hypothetical protein
MNRETLHTKALVLVILTPIAIVIDLVMIYANDRSYFFTILLILKIPGFILALIYLNNNKSIK